jgi:hypothetical protein
MMELDSDSGWRRPLVVLAVVIALGVAAIGFLGTQVSSVLSTVGASVNTPAGGNDGNGVGAGQAGDEDSGGSDDDGAGGSDDGSSGGNPEPDRVELLGVDRPELLIIKTGSIAIQAAELDSALADATTAILGLGGYASGSGRSGDGDDAQASTTFRIPSARWDEAVIAIREIGEKVLDERSETVDVTGQVVDIEARMRNLETTERAFQSIMDRATVIKDVLEVQERLTDVRGEIEELASKAAHLREQAAMSTLSVTFSIKPAPVIARQEARFDPGTEAEAATAQLVGILQSLATAGIWFAIVWLPVLAALAIVGGVGLLVYRRVRRAPNGGSTPMTTAPGGTA